MASRARIIGNQNITVGTVELGDFYGQVISGTVSHVVDEEEVPDALNNTQAIIQTGERKEFSMEVVLDSTAPKPALGDSIVLPSGETAIINKCEDKWSAGKQKTFSIEAVWRDAIGNAPNKAYVTL